MADHQATWLLREALRVANRRMSLDDSYFPRECGKSRNAYEYCSADPLNCTDLDGRFGRKKWRKKAWGRTGKAARWAAHGHLGRSLTEWENGMVIGGDDGTAGRVAP
jgi:hypothetical protein